MRLSRFTPFLTWRARAVACAGLLVPLTFSAAHSQCSGDLPPVLGTVTPVSGACPDGPGPLPHTQCRLLAVQCGGLQPIQVQLRITPPDPGVPERGTVCFGSGGAGTGFYSSQSNASELFRQLTAMGFRVVERAWAAPSGWITGEAGLRRESCRGATLLAWIRDSVYVQGAFVASGNSGGSGELAFALAQWGLGAILDLAVPSGGPPFGRTDYHCGQPTPAEWTAQCPGIVPPDSSDCVPACTLSPTNPTCTQCGPSPTLDELRWDSVLYPGATVSYPRTKVHMLFGRQDCTSAVPMGLLWWKEITTAKALRFVPSTPHFVAGTTEGRDAIRRAIDEGTPPTLAVGESGAEEGGPRVVIGPNPFSGAALLRVILPEAGRVVMRAYDLSGRVVATLMDAEQAAGAHTVTFDPGNPRSGVYFVRVTTAGGSWRGTLVRRR